jgi:hypothetical protein
MRIAVHVDMPLAYPAMRIAVHVGMPLAYPAMRIAVHVGMPLSCHQHSNLAAGCQAQNSC